MKCCVASFSTLLKSVDMDGFFFSYDNQLHPTLLHYVIISIFSLTKQISYLGGNSYLTNLVEELSKIYKNNGGH